MNDKSLTRRQAMGYAAAAGAAAMAAKAAGPARLLEGVAGPDPAQAADCTLTPDKTEGPYFVDERLNRSDIRAGQGGVAVTLTLYVVDTDNGCAPVEGAVVDIWHANAGGKYSDIASEGTSGSEYLRGLQYTDANGKVTFTTIFPGWYSGRAVHMHFKVRQFSGGTETLEFTSQFFFDPSTANAIYSTSAYSSRGTPDTSNSSDGIYGSNGSSLIVPLSSNGSGGYTGTYTIGLSGASSSGGGGSSNGSGSGSGSDASANAVLASISGLRWRRTRSRRRVLRIRSDLDETVRVSARLSRKDRTIAKKTKHDQEAGSRVIELAIPRRTRGGRARLAVAYRDAGGAVKKRTKTVHVPPRH